MTGIPWELASEQTELSVPALHMTCVPQKAGQSFFAPLTLHKILWDSAEWYYANVNSLDGDEMTLVSSNQSAALE